MKPGHPARADDHAGDGHANGRTMSRMFSRIAHKAAEQSGRPYAFVAALALIIGWLLSGPIFGFSDTWQLVINTGTTIVTFLMVFLLQNSQNRDTQAIQLKLDELLHATKGARDSMMDLEDRSDEELQDLKKTLLATVERRQARRAHAPHRGPHPGQEAPGDRSLHRAE